MSYKTIETNNLRLSSDVLNLFRKTKDIWNRYPNLWLMGGGARDVFLNWLNDKKGDYIRKSIELRDLDLVYLGSERLEEEVESEIINYFQEAGYATVDLENNSSLDNFFWTRDNPINEVVLRPDKLIIGERALEAGEAKEIKPSEFEIDKYWKDIKPKLGLRLILLAIQEDWKEKINPLVFEAINAANPFDLYINLYKAFQKGIGEEFYNYIKNNSFLKETSSPEEALIKLDALVYNFEKTPYQVGAFESAKKFDYFNRFDLDQKTRKGKKIRKLRKDYLEASSHSQYFKYSRLNKLIYFLKLSSFQKNN